MLGRIGRLARAPFALTRAQRARREVARGNELLRHGELAAAMKAFTKALDVDPDNEAAWNNRGIVLETLGKPEEALQCHNRAIRIRPTYLDAWCNKGIVLMHMARLDRALECFDTVLKVNPRHPVALMDKGVLRSRQGEHEEALALFNKALEADPAFALAAFNRASSLFALGRYEESIDVYNIALRRRPDLPDAWYFKGRALLETGQTEAAVICLEKAIDLRPDLADARPCPNCASRVVPVCSCNVCGIVAVRADAMEVDRRILCAECKAENPTLFVCEKCSNRFLFEEVAGPHREQFACLLCGTFVDADAKSCPACGAVFEEEAPRAPAQKKERPKRKVRGEYTDADVDEIARIPGVGRAKAEALCRAGYNALWRIKRASHEELGRIRLIGVRGAKMVKDSLRFILLLPQRKSKEEVLSEEYACPLCGCVTSLFAKGCSDCGAVFDEEELDDDLRREVTKELDKGLLAFYDVHLEETPDDTDLWYARALLLLDIDELPEAMKSIDMATRFDPSRRNLTVRSRILAAMREMKQASQVLRGTLAGLTGAGEGEAPAAEPPTGKAAQEEREAASTAFDALSALAE